ncbi:Tap42p [Sugiyamaella lignohabitans]|uniref:Tap42p n=1 Tax=Sugiyamaella lignohabitans TaxID=796027 RepID=A0A161HKX5_9ASCO|nr:Tap42p [Sugiyamaella lignohabitans]ANB12558.1 Tap42p [Sugiyamaella lignohabitans]
MSDQPVSLKSQFDKAVKQQQQLESGKIPFRSDDYSKTYKETLALFNSCRKLADRLGLFSRNESAEDISTSSIRYLSIDYHLAALLARPPPDEGPLDPSRRLSAVKSVIQSHIAFLTQLDAYKILLKSYSSKLQDALQSRENDADSLPDFRLLEGKDAVDRRAQKIEMFKLEKSLEQKIAAFNKAHPASENDTEDSSFDDETYRQVQFAQLGIYALKSFTALQNLAMEVELLRTMPPPPDPSTNPRPHSDDREASRSNTGYTTRLEQPVHQQPLLTKSGKVNRPFTIVSTRDQIAKNAFGTGQTLPTMSVEEYLEEEMKRGGIIEGGGEQSAKQESEDEDDMEAQDRKTLKAREWDEFTEANPKGSGNTINRG